MTGIMITLGAPNDAEGRLSSIARERCKHTIGIYSTRPGYHILLTGGYGEHFNTTANPHAYYTRQYLLSRHIPARDILDEYVESSNTKEDAILSKPVLAKYGVTNVIVITSDFHLERAAYHFRHTFPNLNLTFSGCHTDLPPERLQTLHQHEQRALAQLQPPPVIKRNQTSEI